MKKVIIIINKYNIIIKSKMGAISLSYSDTEITEDYIIISINSLSEKPTHFYKNPKIKDILRLYFEDIEYPTEHGIPMNELDAIQVAKFINQWKNKVNTIVVHCAAGVSRSAGVGAGISKYLNGNDSELNIWGDHQYAPNGLCYKLVCEAFRIGVTEKDIEKLREINMKACDEHFSDETNETVRTINKMFEDIRNLTENEEDSYRKGLKSISEITGIKYE